jgi:hypothetical protein
MKILTWAGVVTLGIVLSACGDSTSNSPQPHVDASAAPSTIAAGGDIELTITTADFTLEAPVGQPNQNGHGHYQVYLDDATGANYLALGSTGSIPVTVPPATVPGAHTLKVALFANDLSPLAPPVSTTVDITVE